MTTFEHWQGLNGESIYFDKDEKKWVLDKNFIFIRHPEEAYSQEEAHVFLDPNILLLKEFEHIYKAKNIFLILINPNVDKKRLAHFKEDYLAHEKFFLYFNKTLLTNYLFLFSMKVKGLYSIDIKGDKLILQTRTAIYKFPLSNMNPWEINKALGEEFEQYKHLELYII